MAHEELINDYKNGMGLCGVCEKYHMGKLKVKKILSENGIEVRKKGKAPMDTSSFVVNDYHKEKYEPHDGYHYVAIDKNSGVEYKDHLNKGGFLTSHIEKEYGVETPTLYDRRMYYMKTGDYWWEQWFDIVEVMDEEKPCKCPYCDWSSNDESNVSGAYTVHLMKAHGLTIRRHLESYPNDEKFFKKQVNQIEKEIMMEDENNYVLCPICNKKFEKITYSHLKSVHNIGMVKFRDMFPQYDILSNRQKEILCEQQKNSNLVVSKKRFISSYEKEIGKFLFNLGVEFETNRQLLIGKEIDIFIKSHNIGIEFDGVKWHTEYFGGKGMSYHLNKTKMMNNKGFSLIHIFEDEFVNKKDVVLSKLKHILMMDYDLPKICGRKLLVQEITSKEAKMFLDKYHLQGFCSSSIYLGGFFCGELVSVMSFKNGSINNSNWELTRFATNYHYRYQGVGSKMFSHFVKNNDINTIVSYADRRWTVNSDNNLYIRLGFVLENCTKPDYKYYNSSVDRYKRFHKKSFSKRKLNKKYGFPMTMTETEMAKELGYDRIWDCGLFKYVWRRDESGQ